ncbi:MAG: hypothetical protein IJ127_27485 [Afipia sp.]|jgi:hypothetical protein|nr:hypothetical protein [Afipia sp.]
MRRYVGDRGIEGLQVTVDGVPLSPRTDVAEFSKNGFEWSYEGPEPLQLALAILVDHLGNDDVAKEVAPLFMRVVVANFSNEWEMTSIEIDSMLNMLRQESHGNV